MEDGRWKMGEMKRRRVGAMITDHDHGSIMIMIRSMSRRGNAMERWSVEEMRR